MKTFRPARKKVRSPRPLAAELKRLRARGRKIVFTNGCFDLIHKGHVSTLERAARLGDVLVVALNSDASVRRLKGPTRPVNRLRDRAEVMAALEAVDYVTWFGEDDPLRLILALRPDVLVKGGDWKPSQIIGGKEVLSWGGKVRSIRYLPGHSTTGILEHSRRGER